MFKLYEQLKQAKTAEEIIEISDKILKENPIVDVNLIFLKGEALTNLKKFDEAITVFKEALQYPGDDIAERAYKSIATCYFNKEEYAKARENLIKASEYSDSEEMKFDIPIF